MSITKTQFRCLLVAYVFVVAFGFFSDIWTGSSIPDQVTKLKPPLLPHTHSLLVCTFELGMGITVLGAALVGIIGIFCLWSPARYIYLIAIFLKIIPSPLTPWLVQTGWECLFGEIELFLDGVILTVCLLGPAKHLFKKNERLSRDLVG